tara:strand:- start:1296 stop:2642 length:1347 start_codon:yes stop_codon:yes gene_type:complete
MEYTHSGNEENMKKTHPNKIITLCMIVKNESHIILECLESMLPYINRYDITDTGSTDGTQDIIKNFFDEHGIPGEVYQSDWKGFGDSGGKIGSRTESLRNCDGKADYAWVIDADDYVNGDFRYPEEMNADGYSLRIGRDDFSWWRTQIFKTGVEWSYVGILHEYAECKTKQQPFMLKLEGNYQITARTMGARNVGITVEEKYSKDAILLEEALKEEPDNLRYQFYLAQSYFDSKQFEKAYHAYQKRVESGGWEEEVFYSLFRKAVCTALMDRPWPEIQQAFLDAYEYRPTRSEPLFQIARLYRMVHNRPRLAYAFAKMALDIPFPENDILFISDDVYRWQVLDEIGATAYYAGKPHVGYHACKRLIEEKLAPKEHMERIQENLKQYEIIVSQIQTQMTEEKINEKMMEKEEKKLKKQKEKEEKRNKEKKPTKVESGKGNFKEKKKVSR